MRRRALVAACLALAGCASSLEPRFVTPALPGEDALAAALEHAPARSERAVVVGLTPAPVKLVAFDLEKRALLWQLPVEAQSAPLIAGSAVVLQEPGAVVVRDLSTGEVRATLRDDGRLVSADGAGERVVVSIGQGEGSPRGTVALVEGDSVRFRRTLEQPVGSVALDGDYVLVPWASQRLTVLAAADGSELVRWTFPTLSVGQARVVGDAAYVGNHTLVKVTGQLPAQRDQPPAGYAPQKRVLPGQPPILRDGYAPEPPPDAAQQRVALTWRLGQGPGAPHAEHDLVALRFYRLVFGLSASADAVRWAQVMEHDQVGGHMTAAGLWLVDDAGTVRLLDGAGSEVVRIDVGMPLQVASVRGAEQVAATAQSAERANAVLSTLHDQLLAAAQVQDDRLVLARAYAIEQLAQSADARVTAELIDLCGLREAPEPVRLAACQRLAARDQGKDEVLAALRTRGSFLEGTAAPPVGALAQAAARMGLAQAAPLLLTHAENPGTRVADLPAVFLALEQLGYRAAVPTLERFVRVHHDEPQGSELSPAIAAALHALGELRAKTARATLEDVARDELATKVVRDDAQKALAMLDAPPVSKTPQGVNAAKTKPEPEAAPEVEVVQVDPRPYALDLARVQASLAPVHTALEHCLTADAAHPPSARIAMIVAGTGAIEGLLVSPTTLQACMEPVLRRVTFPATRLGRQHISHTVVPPAPPAEKPARAANAAKPAGAPKPVAARPAAPAPKPSSTR